MGDRLVGSMLCNVNIYYGVDPNECLMDGYKKIIELFKPLSNKNGVYDIVQEGFQNVILPKDIVFDLVYTSPPYFDYEKYTNDPNQSIKIASTEDDWLTKFLYPSIIKCIDGLKNKGHLILYFSQERGKTYMEKSIEWMKRLTNFYYLGNIFFSDIFLKNLHPIFIFQKSDVIPKELYNPPIEISDVKTTGNTKNKTIHIVRDDLIIGGTKCRATIPYLKHLIETNPKITEFIYLGASNGYAQVALAYSLQLLKSNIKLTIYSQTVNKRANFTEITKLQNLTKYLYHNMNYNIQNKPFRDIWPIIDEYLEKHSSTKLLPFGLDDENFKKYLSDALFDYLMEFVDKIKRLWMVVGSGTLFSILYNLLPKTYFCLVQVGKEFDTTGYDVLRIKLYKSEKKLYEPTSKSVSYPTTLSYDAKVWEFENDFRDEDYIWNVAGVHAKI